MSIAHYRKALCTLIMKLRYTLRTERLGNLLELVKGILLNISSAAGDLPCSKCYLFLFKTGMEFLQLVSGVCMSVAYLWYYDISFRRQSTLSSHYQELSSEPGNGF